MKIRKLEWRNIFSYGNITETVTFDDKGKLWFIYGRCGSGKTSFMSLSKLLFYGKTEGFKATDIANRVNKKGWIRGTVSTEHDEYVIERTFSPSGLKLERNGKPIDIAGMKDLQVVIEEEVLGGIPYTLYSNLVSLSLNGFTSFIKMTPADKKAIVDKIFSLEIINKVNELIKADRKDLGNKINNINSQIFSYNQTIKRSEAELEKLKNSRDSKECEEAVRILDGRIAKADKLRLSQVKIYDEMNKTYNEYVMSCNNINARITALKNSERESQRSLDFYNSGKCPTCGTPFEGKTFDDIRSSLEANLSSVRSELALVDKEYKDAYALMTDYYKKMSDVNEGIKAIDKKKQELLVERAGVVASARTSEGDSIQNIINETNDCIATCNTDLTQSSSKMRLLEITEKLYSSDGIKQEMMSAFIPLLNSEIATTLQSLQFPYNVSFDNNFNASIDYFGAKVEPATMSVGETKEVDLIIVCSIIKMIKKRFPMMNLICLDETVSSVDYETSSGIFHYLKEISSSMALNIIIVSHAPIDENLFDEKIFVEKVSGFTKFHYISHESDGDNA